MRKRYLILLINLLLFMTVAGFAANRYGGPVQTVTIKVGDSITLTANTTGAAAYQWYKNGVPIPGAFKQGYEASQEGLYTVIAYNKASCPSEISEPIQVKLTPELLIIADNKTKTYGDVNPPITISYQGFINGDGPGILTQQPVAITTAVTGSNVGSYPITVSGAQSKKYNIHYQDGTLVVKKAPLTIFAKSDAKYKDGQPYTKGNGVLYSGFVNGEDPSVLQGSLAYTGSAMGAINAGKYSIMPSGFTANNYQITYIPGILTITDRVVDMSVLKVSETRTVRVDENFKYTLTVENKSTVPATQVQLKDALPPELDYVGIASATAGNATYDVGSRTITWALGNVAPLGKAVLSILVKANTHGGITNSATVTSKEEDSNLANNTSSDYKEIGGLFIPNVFTPNNDGRNDTFMIPNLSDYPDNEITIFNRWGNVVYQKKNYQSDWNGGQLNEGTYFYILKVNSSSKSDIYKGYVTLLRKDVNGK